MMSLRHAKNQNRSGEGGMDNKDMQFNADVKVKVDSDSDMVVVNVKDYLYKFPTARDVEINCISLDTQVKNKSCIQIDNEMLNRLKEQDKAMLNRVKKKDVNPSQPLSLDNYNEGQRQKLGKPKKQKAGGGGGSKISEEQRARLLMRQKRRSMIKDEELTPQPTAESTPKPVPTPQPSTRPSPQPTTRPSPQPSTRQTPQPKARPTPQPIAQPTPRPTPKPTVSSRDVYYQDASISKQLTVGSDGLRRSSTGRVVKPKKIWDPAMDTVIRRPKLTKPVVKVKTPQPPVLKVKTPQPALLTPVSLPAKKLVAFTPLPPGGLYALQPLSSSSSNNESSESLDIEDDSEISFIDLVSSPEPDQKSSVKNEVCPPSLTKSPNLDIAKSVPLELVEKASSELLTPVEQVKTQTELNSADLANSNLKLDNNDKQIPPTPLSTTIPELESKTDSTMTYPNEIPKSPAKETRRPEPEPMLVVDSGILSEKLHNQSDVTLNDEVDQTLKTERIMNIEASDNVDIPSQGEGQSLSTLDSHDMKTISDIPDSIEKLSDAKFREHEGNAPIEFEVPTDVIFKEQESNIPDSIEEPADVIFKEQESNVADLIQEPADVIFKGQESNVPDSIEEPSDVIVQAQESNVSDSIEESADVIVQVQENNVSDSIEESAYLIVKEQETSVLDLIEELSDAIFREQNNVVPDSIAEFSDVTFKEQECTPLLNDLPEELKSELMDVCASITETNAMETEDSERPNEDNNAEAALPPASIPSSRQPPILILDGDTLEVGKLYLLSLEGYPLRVGQYNGFNFDPVDLEMLKKFQELKTTT